MTITTITTYKDGARKARIIGAGVDITAVITDADRISWASDWLAIHTLVDAGLARTEFARGCWGHTDVFIS